MILAPLLGVFAFAFDGIYIGATWARDMRNLMVLSLLIFLGAWLALRSFGNAGLWGALLVHYAARGGLQALRYPALLRKSFGEPLPVAGRMRSLHGNYRGLRRLRRGLGEARYDHRPVLGGDGRGIGADDFRQLVRGRCAATSRRDRS